MSSLLMPKVLLFVAAAVSVAVVAAVAVAAAGTGLGFVLVSPWLVVDAAFTVETSDDAREVDAGPIVWVWACCRAPLCCSSRSSWPVGVSRWIPNS